MHKYPEMVEIFAKNYSYKESAQLMEIGRRCLQALCYEIAYEQKIKIWDKDLIEMMPDIMKSEFKHNSHEQLFHLFAEYIFIKRDSHKRHVAKETLLTIINQYNHPETTRFWEPRRRHLQKQQSECESQQENDSLILRSKAYENKEHIFKKEGSFMQAYLPYSLTMNNGEIRKEKEEIVDYIASITIPKTQLSQFCQSVKNVFPSYNRQKVEDIYHITATLIFDNFFTNHVGKEYEFKAKFANLKRAQNQAALGLLEQVWTDYPVSWRRFTENRMK